MKKRKLKTWPIIILIIFIIFVICLINIFSSLKSNVQNEVKVIDTIKKYHYNLNENESSYYKKLFKQLKKELAKKNIKEKEYAILISKMFLTDFFDLNSAINKNDVGGTSIVYSSYKDSFIKSAKDTVYAYVENDIYGNRKQSLPIVTNVKILDIEQKSYYGNTVSDDNAYYLNLRISYKKDLNYQENVELILIHTNDKLEIVNMQ